MSVAAVLAGAALGVVSLLHLPLAVTWTPWIAVATAGGLFVFLPLMEWSVSTAMKMKMKMKIAQSVAGRSCRIEGIALRCLSSAAVPFATACLISPLAVATGMSLLIGALHGLDASAQRSQPEFGLRPGIVPAPSLVSPAAPLLALTAGFDPGLAARQGAASVLQVIGLAGRGSAFGIGIGIGTDSGPGSEIGSGGLGVGGVPFAAPLAVLALVVVPLLIGAWQAAAIAILSRRW